MNEVLSHKLADLKECIERIQEDWRRPSDMSLFRKGPKSISWQTLS